MIWSIGSKGCDNYMPASSDGSSNNFNITLTISRLCQKMKYSSIMPHIIDLLGKIYLGDVCFNPIYVGGASTESFLSLFKCSSRNIQNSDILKTICQQIVYQC